MKKKIIAVMLMLAVVAAACACGNKENEDVPVTAWNTATQSPAPVVEPTAEPTAAPTAEPTAEPTAAPTAEPTTEPTAAPMAEPTAAPTAALTAEPITAPTAAPTAEPITAPTAAPTAEPTAAPTIAPTAAPTIAPTAAPTVQQASTAELYPGTGITQQYIDDICTYYGASVAVVRTDTGENMTFCASWCRSNWVGKAFAGDDTTAEWVCTKLGLQGWAHNEGTPTDFYTATGQLQPISAMTAEQLMQAMQAVAAQTAAQDTVQAAAPIWLRNLDLYSNTLAQWIEVKEYRYGDPDADKVKEEQRNIINTLKGLYSLIEAMASRPEGMADREKVTWASNRIAETVGYNQNTYSSYLKGDSNYSDPAYYLTGALAGSAVCDGYADLFALYMYLDGIPCQEIHGTAFNGKITGGHAWNRVLVDGQWLEVDTTWNDTLGTHLTMDGKTYHDGTDAYLLLTHDEMAVDHFEEYAVDLTAELDALFAGAGFTKDKEGLARLAAMIQPAITAKQQVVDAYTAAYVEATRRRNKTNAGLIAKEQGLRDGTLVVVDHKLYGSDGMYRCSVGMTNTITGEHEDYTHLPEVYGCTKEECMWLKEVISGN